MIQRCHASVQEYSMLTKYLVCSGVCIIILFLSLLSCFISCNRIDKCEEQNKPTMTVVYAAILVIGILFSLVSGIGMIVLVTQTLDVFLQG